MPDVSKVLNLQAWYTAGAVVMFAGLQFVAAFSDAWFDGLHAQIALLARVCSLVLAFAWVSLNFRAAFLVRSVCQLLILLATLSLYAGQRPNNRSIADGFVVDTFAAYPDVAKPTALCVDSRNRLFVVEGHSFAFQDLIGYEEQIASRTLVGAERLACSEDVTWQQADRVRMLQDSDNDGSADLVTTVVDGFPLHDGVACGIAVRDNTMWLGNAPKLWRCEDTNGDERFEKREALHHGFGVRRKFRGHGIHGLIFGPDGKLYFTTGDRGLQVQTDTGRELYEPDSGSVLRCNPDGSQLEVFATGLRNPYGLAFDKYGNLWTADNDSNMGDQSRWVYVVEGGNSGWQIGYQPLPAAGPFNSERIWDPKSDIPFRVPAAGCVGIGPAGMAYCPGTGLPESFDGRFLLCDHAGVVLSLAVEAAGAGYRIRSVDRFLYVQAPTDVAFGTDGSIYVAVWGNSNFGEEQSQILRVRHRSARKDPTVEEVRILLAEGTSHRTNAELISLLGHQDLRVRQESQFALASRGSASIAGLHSVLASSQSQLARIHAIWGLGQIGAREPAALRPLVRLLSDDDPEIRAIVAKVVGDRRYDSAYNALVSRLEDTHPRVMYFASLALGKLGRPEAGPAIIRMLRLADGGDAYLRHAGAMALAAIGDIELLQTAATDASRTVRVAALLAMRRLKRHEIVTFLDDCDPLIVLAAIRAIHDVPIEGCLPELAELIHRPELSEPALLRVINAHYRLGTGEAAKRLAEFARRKDVPATVRVDALKALADWLNCDRHDRVLGSWRPLPSRTSSPAREALQCHLAEFLQDPREEVVLAAHSASAALGIESSSEALRQRVFDATLPSQLRADALQVLVERRADDVAAVIDYAWKSDDLKLRLQAVDSLPEIEGPETAAMLFDLAIGQESTSIRQAAVSALGACQTREPELALMELVHCAVEGDASPELYLELVEAVEQSGSRESDERLQSLALRMQADKSIGDHWVSLYGGNPRKGRDIFSHHPAAQCVRCHGLGEQEQRAGPSLARAGRYSRRQLLESLIQPNATIVDGYGQTTLQLTDGRTVTGIIESADESRIRLRLPSGRHQEYQEQHIEQRSRPRSGMPVDFASKLSKREIRDLVAFLAELGNSTTTGQYDDKPQ